ncbi:MAG: hypothetical protein C0625_08430 [Arcobacter sp.]|nr:MAG: hypothetical protein C0625_08430 [Arcobacter sp.]
MKKFFANAKRKASVVATSAVVIGSNAMASSGVLTAPTFDLTDVGTVAGALLVGLAGFWAIKKGLSLARA